MPAWCTIGDHRCYVDGNLFVMELNGPVRPDQIVALLAPQDELLQHHSSILTLCDARRTTIPDPQVRRYLAERGQRLGQARISSVVITNSVLLQTAVTLVERASRLLSGRPLDTAFVTTEQAAWKWIAERRLRDADSARDGH